MEEFFYDLMIYCQEKEHIPRSLRRHREQLALEALEEQIEATMGKEFWNKYINASLRCSKAEDADTFRAGVRFGVELMRGIETYF